MQEIITISSEDALMLFTQSMEDDMEKDNNFLETNFQERVLYFTRWIDSLHDGGLTYLEAIVDFCDKHDVEYENITKLITESMKMKIYDEAVSLNQVKKSDAYVSSFL